MPEKPYVACKRVLREGSSMLITSGRSTSQSGPSKGGILMGLIATLAFVLAAFPHAGFAAPQQGRVNLGGSDSASVLSVARAVGSPRDEFQYSIAPDDLLNIDVVDVPELTREYRVSPEGTITLPWLPKPIVALDLTTAQLSAVISDQLRTAGLVSHPNVVVTVKASRVHSVAIMGAVKKPQIYPLFGTTTLLDVLSQAEGLADDAGNTAIVTRGDTALRIFGLQPGLRHQDQSSELMRPAGGTEKVDLKELMETGNSGLNTTIYPGDRVMVERAGIVYVVGAVNRPGGFTLRNDREEMTVLKALALGEGLKSTAQPKNAMIIRQGHRIPGGREEIAVNLPKILAGRVPDRQLQPNDILFVPDSAPKKAFYRGAEAAVQVATGVIVYRR